MDKLEELCPYCGGKAQLDNINGLWYVVCEDCGAAPPLLYYTGSNAIAAWNDNVRVWNAQWEDG